MDAKLRFDYDREADVLYVRTRTPYAEQESEELGDDVVARLNPDTGEVESLEVLFFSTRLMRSSHFELPVLADMRLRRDHERWVIAEPSALPLCLQ